MLVDFNESSVDLWDVTDKAAPVRLSTTTFPTATYVHSGWPTADNMFIVVHDELDELQRGLNTHIYTLDIADLRTPSLVTSFIGGVTATDHNGYTIGNRYYVSHYKRGLVIFDVTNPRALTEIGSFDTYLSPTGQFRGHGWRVGRLSIPDVGHLAGERHRKRHVRAAQERDVAAASAASRAVAIRRLPRPGGGGGGGGAVDPALLILFAGLAMLRARRKT